MGSEPTPGRKGAVPGLIGTTFAAGGTEIPSDQLAARGLSIIQHSLGVDQFGRGPQFRDHFCAGPDHSDFETCCALAEAGLMTRRDGLPVCGGTMFYVTGEGRRWMAEHSPSPPKLTRSQQRYQRYLDSDSELSFGEWLQREAAPRPSWFA